MFFWKIWVRRPIIYVINIVWMISSPLKVNLSNNQINLHSIFTIKPHHNDHNIFFVVINYEFNEKKVQHCICLDMKREL